MQYKIGKTQKKKADIYQLLLYRLLISVSIHCHRHPGAGAKTFVLESANGGPLPCFRAGQYLSLKLKIGGSGITPFLSMARAIADGTEDFDLIILFSACSSVLHLWTKTRSQEHS